MSDNPYTDDEYDNTYKEVHGDEPARDQYTDGPTDDTFFPSGVGNSLTPSGWGIWPTSDAADATTEYDDEAGRDRRTGYDDRAGTEDDDDGSLLGEGLVAALLIVGAILFVFPEPATSAVGIAMVAMGVVAWIAEWAMS